MYDFYYEFIVWLDGELEVGRLHIWNRNGQLLTTLDQVVNALLAEEL